MYMYIYVLFYVAPLLHARAGLTHQWWFVVFLGKCYLHCCSWWDGPRAGSRLISPSPPAQ